MTLGEIKTISKASGHVEQSLDSYSLALGPLQKGYANGQIDDYHWKSRRDFCNVPNLKLSLKARWEGPTDGLHGTSGFGFWNDPFMMTGWRWPSLPQAIWFLVSCPKSNLSLNPDCKNKAGLRSFQVNAWHRAFLKKLFLWMLRAPFWNFAKEQWIPQLCKDIECTETFIDLELHTWNHFEIFWQDQEVSFYVNGELVQNSKCSIKSPLGLVIWMDNQYLVFDPWLNLRYGNCTISKAQALHIKDLNVERLP
jgi:hypothetical protein